jgi:hypothetical protein
MRSCPFSSRNQQAKICVFCGLLLFTRALTVELRIVGCLSAPAGTHITINFELAGTLNRRHRAFPNLGAEYSSFVPFKSRHQDHGAYKGRSSKWVTAREADPDQRIEADQ